MPRKAALLLAGLLAGTMSYAAEMKLGFFDFQRVSEETTRGQELQSSLAKFRDKKQGEISGKETELKTLRDQYAAQALSLSPDRRSQMEKDIQKKDLELQSARESAQKEMQIEVNEAQNKFQEQLFKVISSIGKERGYTVIFEKSQAVFTSDSADMTGEIIEKFNQETTKEPAAAGSAEPKKSGDDKAPAPKPSTTSPPKPSTGSKPPATKPPQGR